MLNLLAALNLSGPSRVLAARRALLCLLIALTRGLGIRLGGCGRAREPFNLGPRSPGDRLSPARPGPTLLGDLLRRGQRVSAYARNFRTFESVATPQVGRFARMVSAACEGARWP